MPTPTGPVRDAVSRHAADLADNRVFCHPDIPPERLAEALAGYPSARAEEVLVLLDNTASGSADEGALLLADALLVRDGGAPVRRFALPELASVAVDPGPPRTLEIGGVPVLRHLRPNPATLERFAALLREVASLAGNDAHGEEAAMPPAPPSTVAGEPPSDPVADWLRSMGMERHAALFRENRVKPEHLEGLTDADLSAIGIAALGDRRAILAAVAARKGTTARDEASRRETEARERARRFDRGCLKAALAATALCALLGLVTSGGEGLLGMALVGVLGCLALYLYSLPAVLAFRRGHEHRWAILLANWLLGVTGVVWVVLLCYSTGLIGSGATVALGYFAGRK
jgi:hypothetical protein